MASSSITSQIKNRLATINPIEKERVAADSPDKAAKSMAQPITAASADFFGELLGINTQEQDLIKPYEKFTLYSSDRKTVSKESPKPAKIERRKDIAPGVNYHSEVIHNSERSLRKENRELQSQIQEIYAELQRLVNSSNKIIQMEFGSISVTPLPVAVGKYHTNFLTWMLTVIVTARQKVEDSAAWMAVAKGKGRKRGYSQSAKSHGTSFTQSNERQVATQTG